MDSGEIPCATKQGIFRDRTEKICARTGIAQWNVPPPNRTHSCAERSWKYRFPRGNSEHIAISADTKD